MFKKIILGALLSVLIIGQLTFDSKAANVAYNSVYAEPELDGNSGYLLTHTTPNGVGVLTIYYWKITPSTGNTLNPRMDLTINSSSISFTPLVDGSNGQVGRAYVVLYRLDDNGTITRVKNSLFDSSLNFNVSTSVPHASSVYGNYGAVTNNVHGNSVPSVTVTWGGTVNNYNLIADVYNSVMNIYHQSVGANERLSILAGKLDTLTSEVDNVEETLNSMYSLMTEYYDCFDKHLQNIYDRLGEQLSEQKKSNTFLEKILKFLEQKDEKDKQAATQQGSSSTSQGMDAIDDKGGDFANSLGGLTNSMSYSGTQCAWEFPEVKIPGIPGVMNEVVLIQRQPIDFAQWVNAIPSDILLVVQSVCTIGLIVFCFKELYNTIAYVLTLRRDDNE